MSRTREATLADTVLELHVPPLVVQSCAAHNSKTLKGIFMILRHLVKDIE